MTREEVIKILRELDEYVTWHNVHVAHEALDIAIKTIEQKEKTGHWFIDERPESGKEVICSNCEQPVFKYHKLEFDYRPNYCPNCGAKMGVKDD